MKDAGRPRAPLKRRSYKLPWPTHFGLSVLCSPDGQSQGVSGRTAPEGVALAGRSVGAGKPTFNRASAADCRTNWRRDALPADRVKL